MKHSLSLLASAALAIVALTPAQAQNNSGWDYYWNKSDSSGLTPYHTEKTTEGKYNYVSFEYASAINQNHNRASLNGGLLSLNVYDNVNANRVHQFILQTGYLKGDKKLHNGADTKFIERNFPLTVGYNANLAVTDRILLYAGVKGGLVFGDAKLRSETGNDSGSDTAPVFGAGAGIKIMLSNRVDFIFGYDYQKNFTKYMGENYYNNFHILHAGFSFGF